MSEAIINAIIAGISSSENATEQAIEVVANLERAGFPARLIAAAPDGLEMAREISMQYENQDLNHVDFRIMAKQLADAFIAKATEPRP